MARHPGRGGAEWEAARRYVLAAYTHCHICGRVVDFDAPARSRWSPSVDHLLPLSAMEGLDMELQRELATDVSRLRLAHYGCNSGRGDRPVRRLRVEHSRSW